MWPYAAPSRRVGSTSEDIFKFERELTFSEGDCRAVVTLGSRWSFEDRDTLEASRPSRCAKRHVFHAHWCNHVAVEGVIDTRVANRGKLPALPPCRGHLLRQNLQREPQRLLGHRLTCSVNVRQPPTDPSPIIACLCVHEGNSKREAKLSHRRSGVWLRYLLRYSSR